LQALQRPLERGDVWVALRLKHDCAHDIAVGVAKLKEQMSNPMFVTKGGVGYGVDETQKVEDDGKGWVWLAAEMSPGGLAVELFKSVPYGKRAILVAKQSNVDELFQKVGHHEKGAKWVAQQLASLAVLPGLLRMCLRESARARHIAADRQVNWDTALGNIEKTFGGPQIKQR
ncbi:unnamed protein product, partial [Durusdinium trenchii]